MATTAMDYESANGDRYDGILSLIPTFHYQPLTRIQLDEAPRYERDPRSASPRPSRDDGMEISRRRSASPGANHDR